MGLKLLGFIIVIYGLSFIFDAICWLALFFFMVTMFLLLPIIYYINKISHSMIETKNFFKHETALLTPGIKKRGFYKTLSKVSYNDFSDDKETNIISPFPSRRVEDIVDEIIEEIIKYYVLPYTEANNWKLKNTEVFLKKFLKKLLSEVVHRMSMMEWNMFFCNTLIDNVKNHIVFLKSRSNQSEDSTYFMGSKTENLFVEAVSNRLLRSLLDGKYVQCELIYQFCLAILAHQVVKRTVDYYCDPVNHNQWLFRHLIERKLTRSKLNKQLPHFQYDMSFEDFFKMVESIGDLNEVKQIKQKLQNELRMAEVLKFTQSNIDSKHSSKKPNNSDTSKSLSGHQHGKPYKGHLLTQRDLKCYSNQLSTLLDTVNTKLKMMTKARANINIPSAINSITKSNKRHSKGMRRNSKSSNDQKQTLSKKIKLKVASNFSREKRTKSISERSSALNECIPYETIMHHNEGRKFFKEFLNTTAYSRTVELIEMLTYLQNHPEDQHVIAQGVVKRYIHSSPPAFEFDRQLVKEMDEFLIGNSTEKVFVRAKAICDKELKQRWYPYFVLSPNYEKFSKHLNKEINAIESMKRMDISPPGMSTDTGEMTDDSDDREAGSHESANDEPSIKPLLDDDDNQPPLLFDFTQNLPTDPADETHFTHQSIDETNKPISETFDAHTDEEFEEEDGFLKPFFEEMNPSLTSGQETREHYHQKIRRLDKKIDVKEKAYNAGVAVSNQMPLSKKEKSKMILDLCSVKEDLNRLYEKRNKCQYNLNRVDKWMLSMGNWNAVVYDIILPEPKRGTSLDLGYLPTLAEMKPGSSATVDREEISTDDDTKQIIVFIMVSLTSTETKKLREDNGWLIKHTLKDFQALKKELSSISSIIDKVSLPKVPQRLFLRRKYTDNDISHIKDCLNQFITFIMKTPILAKSETVFKFFCSSVDSSLITNEDTLTGPLSSLANTLSDASAKVMLMAKIPTKFVQKVLAPRKHSDSVTSLDSESTDSRSDKKNSFRRISGASHTGGGSVKHKMRKLSHSKDISMSAFELLEELIQLRKSMTLTRRSMITFVQSFFGKNLTQILTEKVAFIKSESTVFMCLQKYRDSFRIDHQPVIPTFIEPVAIETETKLHPSASAFISQTVSDSVDSNLEHVNSNSSPTMNKARFYQKSNTVSSENLAGTTSSKPDGTDTAVTSDKSGIHFNQSWTYSIKCDEAVKRLVWEAVPEYWKTLFGTMSVADSVGFVFESLQSLEANKALVYRILQSFVEELLEEDDGPLYLAADKFS